MHVETGLNITIAAGKYCETSNGLFIKQLSNEDVSPQPVLSSMALQKHFSLSLINPPIAPSKEIPLTYAYHIAHTQVHQAAKNLAYQDKPDMMAMAEVIALSVWYAALARKTPDPIGFKLATEFAKPQQMAEKMYDSRYNSFERGEFVHNAELFAAANQPCSFLRVSTDTVAHPSTVLFSRRSFS